MAPWTASSLTGPQDRMDVGQLQRLWSHLHRGDAEPWPEAPELQNAWLAFHNGDFQRATETGLGLGDAGMNVANKATSIYANYLEPREQHRHDLLLAAAARAEDFQRRQPENPGAWFWQAYPLARYIQSISVAKALTQGLGSRVKTALEAAIERCPQHADAHLALGTFHAEVIDKVGAVVGRMTYGANKAEGLAMYRQALALNPDAITTLTEYANGLIMLEGLEALSEANRLLDRVATIEPLDEAERLYAASARAVLEG